MHPRALSKPNRTPRDSICIEIIRRQDRGRCIEPRGRLSRGLLVSVTHHLPVGPQQRGAVQAVPTAQACTRMLVPRA